MSKYWPWSDKPLVENKLGYHITPITKGVLGEWSKVCEEYYEYLDAQKQDSKIMMSVELADLYGALMAFALNPQADRELIAEGLQWTLDEAIKLGLGYYDLMVFSKITERAFRNGRR